MQSWVPISVCRGSSNTTAEKCLQAVYLPYLTQPQHSIPASFTFALLRGNNALHYPSIHFLPLTFMLWSYKMLLCVSDGRYHFFLKASPCLMCPAKPSQVKDSFTVHEYLNKTWNKSLNLYAEVEVGSFYMSSTLTDCREFNLTAWNLRTHLWSQSVHVELTCESFQSR